MIAVTTNTDSFDVDLEKAFAILERKMSLKFASFTYKVFESIVVTSPQWSGNFASNWNYSVGYPDETYTALPEKESLEKERLSVFQVGSSLAVGRALGRANSVEIPTWRVPVYITNATPDDESNYLVKSMSEGKINLRPVNLVPAQGAVIEFTMQKFQEHVL